MLNLSKFKATVAELEFIAQISYKSEPPVSELEAKTRESLNEEILRRLFRPHWEFAAGSDTAEQANARNSLHTLLHRLLRVEVAASTGCLKTENIEEIVGAGVIELFRRSPATAQFIDDYDYFGVRFLVSRLNPPLDKQIKAMEESLEKLRGKPREDLHAEIAALKAQRIQLAGLPDMPAPPPIAGAECEMAEQFLETSAKLDAPPAIEAFFLLLEGCKVQVPDLSPPLTIDAQRFRQWLQGLRAADGVANEGEKVNEFLEGIRKAAVAWCVGRSKAYQITKDLRVQARLFIFDFRAMEHLFGAETSRAGVIAFPNPEWYDDLKRPLVDQLRNLDERSQYAIVKRLRCQIQEIDDARKVIAKAGSLACNLLLGTPFGEGYQDGWTRPSPICPTKMKADEAAMRVKPWSQVYHEELEEIARYRWERPESNQEEREGRAEPSESNVFSVRTNLVGLALSGGGIRSATFCLGVLEGLKELDLLRRVDFLSTVSGGGYIGSWLTANAYRRPGWLRKASDWNNSIEHLRRYSNYLSPQVGFFSADTWTMFTIWSRNTLLMQILLVLCMAVVLLVPHALKLLWEWSIPKVDAQLTPASYLPHLGWELIGLAFLALSVVFIAWNLGKLKQQQGWGQNVLFHGLILAPMVVSAFVFSMLLWWYAAGPAIYEIATSYNIPVEYSKILVNAWRWWWPTLLGLLAMLTTLTFFSLANPGKDWRRGIPWTLVPLILVYAMGCAILKLYLSWLPDRICSMPLPPPLPKNVWYAFTFGPPLVVWGFALAIVLLLGVLSRLANDEKREWWSRVGAWLVIYGVTWMIVALGAIFAPLWVEKLHQKVHWSWGGIVWIATTWGGLLAGKSETTNGARKEASMSRLAQEALARVAPFVFIAGLVAIVGTGIHALLLTISVDSITTYSSAWNTYSYWTKFQHVDTYLVRGVWIVWWVLGIVIALALSYSWRLDINVFSLNNFYRNRLVRCYLGATREYGARDSAKNRHEQPFTGFDMTDDLPLYVVRHPGINGPLESKEVKVPPFAGPFPIVNCALNLGGSADLELHTRQSASFTFTPLHAGSGRVHQKKDGTRIESVKYAPLKCIDSNGNEAEYYGGRGGSPLLGEVIATSGAAASPNQGYHTSPVVAFLMTVFNVRLGWWFPHPSKGGVREPAPRFAFMPFFAELFGMAGDKSKFLNLSDGGHFENLGIYELVRRRCRIIIASDAECDPDLSFESLGSVIRMCDADFGTNIDIDVSAIRKNATTSFSTNYCAVGRIKYRDGLWGWLIYMKASMISAEATSIKEYKSSHPAFPHETTADQFFSEDQFESYRLLGREVATRTFRDVNPVQPFVQIAENLINLWTAKLTDQGEFVRHASVWMELLAKLRRDPDLQEFRDELMGGGPAAPSTKAYLFCEEMFQVMENAYLGLALDDTWDHPDNAGWKGVFLDWGKSPTFRKGWAKSQLLYGKRFRMFCQRELGLSNIED